MKKNIIFWGISLLVISIIILGDSPVMPIHPPVLAN